MADYRNIIPFIKQAEGGYVNDPNDAGGETNKGITWSTWQSVFGSTHDQFIAMTDADWQYVFKSKFWDAISGDQINNQTIADFIVDWYWMSGVYATRRVQQALNSLGEQLNVDGKIGPRTVAAINAADPQALYDALSSSRNNYYNAIVQADPTQQRFLQGWLNRLNSFLADFPLADTIAQATGTDAGTVGAVGVFFCLVPSLLQYII